MSSDDWKLAWSLFRQALDLPESGRAAFLERSGASPGVIAHVATLLGDETEDALASTGTPPDPAAPGVLENSPLWVGPYRLEKILGEGAMGTVYRAEQERPLRRTVALKIVRPGLRGKELLERFEIERRVLAMMEHPNIARVYDAGQTAGEGHPYFVMEYVAGVPITRYCDTHRLALRERLELLITVCHAIQHAHQKGVIHRDIKPSNILVAAGPDGRPTAKVIDFGVARAMESAGAGTLATRFGSVVGTLAYMSPEQATLDSARVDTRSDIYSLGVLAYELLVGETPLQGDTETASLPLLIERVRTVEPEPPSVRARNRGRSAAGLDGEADWIVMKALEKEPARRYQTADALALDIRAFLDGDAVEAGPPSRSYKLRKMAVRYRAVIAVALAFALVLIGATVFSVRQAILATEARREADAGRDQARNAEQQARQERDRAVAAEQRIRNEQELTMAEKLRADRESAVARAVDDFLRNDLLAQASPFTQSGAIGERPNPDITVRQVLDRAAATVEQKLAPQPAVQAAIEDTIAGAYLDLGLYDQSLRHADRAIALRRPVVPADHPDLLASLDRRASALQGQAKYAEAETVWKGIADVSRRRSGDAHRDTLQAEHRLGMLHRARGKYREAEQALVKVLEVRRRTLGPEHPDTLRTAGDLASVYLETGRQPDAEKLQRMTYDTRRKLLGEMHPETLGSLSYLARAIHFQSRPAEAEPLYRKALEGQRAILGATHSQTLGTLDGLGSCLMRLGRAREAVDVRVELIAALERERGVLHPSTLMANHNLACAYQVMGEHRRALEGFNQCLGGQRQALGAESAQVLLTMYNSATSMQYLGRFEEAVSTLQHVIAARRRLLGDGHPSVQMARSSLGAALAGLGRGEEAIAEAGSAWEIRRQRFGDAHFQTGHAAACYATALLAAGRVSQAREMAEKAAAINGLLGEDHPDTIEADELVALADLASGQPREAERRLERAAAARVRRFGPQHAPLVRTNLLLAMAQQAAGHHDHAAATVGRLLSLPRAAAEAESSWERALAQSLQGALFAAQGRFEDAEPILDQGLDQASRHWSEVPEPVRAEARKLWRDLSRRYANSGRTERASHWARRLAAFHTH